MLVPRADESPWHLATNHLRSTIGPGSPSGCWRYDTIRRRLENSGGRLETVDALSLLGEVAQENTQWSVIYDVSGRDVQVAMGRAYERAQAFSLRPADDSTGVGE